MITNSGSLFIADRTQAAADLGAKPAASPKHWLQAIRMPAPPPITKHSTILAIAIRDWWRNTHRSNEKRDNSANMMAQSIFAAIIELFV
jgi:hypothetical protein